MTSRLLLFVCLFAVACGPPERRRGGGQRVVDAGTVDAGSPDAGDGTDAGALEPENTPDACSDRIDNDGDGYVDCDDYDCRGVGDCHREAPDHCGDFVDNDGDGLTDCADPECAGVPPCGVEICDDLIDNDGDGLVDCNDDDCVCAKEPVRVGTWNVEALGEDGSAQWTATLDIVRRIDADVLCLQEVLVGEQERLSQLALETGYPHAFQGRVRTAMAGDLTNACLSRFPFVSTASLGSSDLSADPFANETGRDIVEVVVALSPGGPRLAFWSVHLKAGFTAADEVRRQVEMLRVAQAVRRRAQAFPGEVAVVLGDFNEGLGDSAIGTTHQSAPIGLPLSWRLGADLSFPLVYDPFAPLFDEGLSVGTPTLEDSTATGTRIPSSRRIDYVFWKHATLVEDLVYDACHDDGIDQAPPGDFLELFGQPLSCGTSLTASDHRPVLVELVP